MSLFSGVHSEVDVFVGNYTFINWDIYDLWIKGCGPQETYLLSKEKETSIFPNLNSDHMFSEINDYFRLFSNLEQILLATGKISEQFIFQLDEKSKKLWVEKYYSLDDGFCREIMGKKLSSRLKKDLDDISDKTHVHLKAARRQFDNIKRIFKSVEEMPGSLPENIMNTFHLDKCLSEKYASLVFIASSRLEVNKRKLNYLSFDDIHQVSLLLMKSWSKNSGDDDQPLDREYLSTFRELRSLSEKDKEIRSLVMKSLRLTCSKASEIEGIFKVLSRNIINIAVGLYNSKEIKDFYIHVVEKIVEPFKLLQCSHEDVSNFLQCYSDASSTHCLLSSEETRIIFRNYMSFLIPVVLVFYPH